MHLGRPAADHNINPANTKVAMKNMTMNANRRRGNDVRKVQWKKLLTTCPGSQSMRHDAGPPRRRRQDQLDAEEEEMASPYVE
mmetsp:Transcript_34620/g.69951  ORF Transcript_34620/g.69951 Transcript_34620/m.69951 type:complete len:83 (-) Transcript_34620:196-444(-)